MCGEYGEKQNLKHGSDYWMWLVVTECGAENDHAIQYMPILSQLRKQNSSLKEGNSPPTWLFTYLAQTVPLNAKDYAICCVYKLIKRERGPALTNVHPKRGTDNQQANNPSDAVKSLVTNFYSTMSLD